MTHVWTAENGDAWELTSGDSGVWLGPGVRGVGMPPTTHFWIEGAATNGARWNGAITEKRTVFWPIAVYNNAGSQAWIDYDRRFWNSLQPEKRGTWTVTQPGTQDVAGQTRSLRLRFADDGDWAPDIDPALVGWGNYGVTLIAEQPFWEGPTISNQWGQGSAAVNFFGGGSPSAPGAGPAFYISSGSSIATASITNIGDVSAWPVWTIFGPCTSATVGLAGKTIAAPITLNSGEWLQINTAPSSQVAWFGSGTVDIATATNRTSNLGAVSFASVPPAANVPLSVALTGTGRVRIELTPLYRRAW
jgi:hypothetical protein